MGKIVIVDCGQSIGLAWEEASKGNIGLHPLSGMCFLPADVNLISNLRMLGETKLINIEIEGRTHRQRILRFWHHQTKEKQLRLLVSFLESRNYQVVTR